MFPASRYVVEVGRYTENTVLYRQYYWYRIDTLNVGFFDIMDIVSVTGEISGIFRSYFFRLLDVNLKTNNYMSEIEDPIWNVIRRYASLISTSMKRKLNNIDVIDYFTGDNERYE